MKKNNSGYSDVDTLTMCNTIASNFTKDYPDFARYGDEFTEAYANDLSDRVGQMFNEFIGVDKAKAQKQATRNVRSIFEVVKDDVIILKKRIKTKFPDNTKEMYELIGLHKNLDDIHNKKQTALVELLYVIKKGLAVQSVFDQFTEKQIPAAFLTDIINHADFLNNAHETQETAKINKPLFTKEVSLAIYVQYQELNGICEVAKTLYKDDIVMYNRYNWSHLAAQLHSGSKKRKPTDDKDNDDDKETDINNKNAEQSDATIDQSNNAESKDDTKDLTSEDELKNDNDNETDEQQDNKDEPDDSAD